MEAKWPLNRPTLLILGSFDQSHYILGQIVPTVVGVECVTITMGIFVPVCLFFSSSASIHRLMATNINSISLFRSWPVEWERKFQVRFVLDPVSIASKPDLFVFYQ
jgi:hypothetical protein